MKGFRTVCVVLFIMAASVVFSACEAMQYHTPARQRRRRHVMDTDFYHMADDIDWLLGLDRPSRLYDQTLR